MTKEQQDLVPKARESLRAAELLAGQELYDFAISRAYYTMFYVAEAFLLEKGLSFSKHSAVRSAFGKHFAKTEVLPPEYHRYLIDAEKRRIVGDYGTGPGLSRRDAAQEIEQAEAFIALAEAHLDPA